MAPRCGSGQVVREVVILQSGQSLNPGITILHFLLGLRHVIWWGCLPLLGGVRLLWDITDRPNRKNYHQSFAFQRLTGNEITFTA